MRPPVNNTRKLTQSPSASFAAMGGGSTVYVTRETEVVRGESPSSAKVTGAREKKRRDTYDRRLHKFFDKTAGLVYYVVAAVLMLVVFAVIYHSVSTLVPEGLLSERAATNVVSGALCAVVILEIIRTVLTRSLKIEPFLIVGIVSALREVLMVGANLSLGGLEIKSEVVHKALLELGVNAAVAIGLVAVYILNRRLGDKPSRGLRSQ